MFLIVAVLLAVLWGLGWSRGWGVDSPAPARRPYFCGRPLHAGAKGHDLRWLTRGSIGYAAPDH